MKEFRSALEGYLAGELEPAAAQAQITAAIMRSPQLAPAMLATIEGFSRAGRVAPELAVSLSAVVNAAVAAARAAPPSPPVPPPAPPTPPPPPAPPAPAGDKTQYRPVAPPPVPASASVPDVAPAPSSVPAEASDKTQFRPVRAPPPPVPATSADDKTHYRPVAPPPVPASVPNAVPAPSSASAAASDKTHLRPLPPRPVAESAHAPPTGTSVPESGRTSGGSSVGTSAGSWTNFGQMGATPGEQLSIGSVLVDRYLLESIVKGGDRGGMGIVYKALDLRQQEAQERNPYVAIKVLNEDFKRHPDSIKALVKETNKTRKLSHPNIINVHNFDWDKGKGNVFMAMELLEGSPLNELIRVNRDRGGLSLAEALKIIRGLSEALAHAHASRIVHSDFKPGNAFLTEDGRVKVLDFGIARAAHAGGVADGDRTTFDAGTLGALTMPYASCEQIEGQEPDTSDDVYALGVVSYELLTGRHPFERELSVPPRQDREDRREDGPRSANEAEAAGQPGRHPVEGLAARHGLQSRAAVPQRR